MEPKSWMVENFTANVDRRDKSRVSHAKSRMISQTNVAEREFEDHSIIWIWQP
jgi:hypothetical protein